MNLRFGMAEDGTHSWRFRKTVFPELLNRLPADFYCFQEANNFQIDFLNEVLGDYHLIGRRSPAPEFWQHNIIFYHPRWKCMASDHFYLSPTPSIPSRFRKSKWPRQCTLGEFYSRSREVVCINTHFDFDPGVQADSAKLILSRIDAFPKENPVIACGDFNSSPQGPAYKLFTESGSRPPFKNVFSAPFPATHHGFTGERDGNYIDWILYRGNIQKKHAAVISTAINGIYPSDHFPVTATFSRLGA
ncbi:MAG: endonuclease/exonuclease/phosphatase family protein [Desulfobacterales bacterium]